MKKLLLEPNSYTGRAFKTPQLSALPSVMDYNRPEVQRVEMPSANMLGSARAVATVYRAAERAVSTGGRDNPLGLTPQRGESDIVVPVPELTPQQRQEMAKLAKKAMEVCSRTRRWR